MPKRKKTVPVSHHGRKQGSSNRHQLDSTQNNSQYQRPISHSGNRHSGNRRRLTVATGSSESNAESTSSNNDWVISQSTSRNNQDAPNLPGFYYDKIKKRYFKILPGASNVQDGTVITRSEVDQRQHEDKRKTAILELDKTPKASNFKIGLKHLTSRNIFDMQNSVQSGVVLPRTLFGKYLQSQIRSLKPRTSLKVYRRLSMPYDKVDGITRLLPSSDGKKLLCLFNVADAASRIQVFDLHSIQRDNCDTTFDLKILPCPRTPSIVHEMCVITSLTWADNEDSADPASAILYVFSPSFDFLGRSIAVLRTVNGDNVQRNDYRLGNHFTGTCAWNRQKPIFSVGNDECGLVLDVPTRRMWEMDTEKNRVNCQQFSPNGQCLYSGTKKGSIFCHDMRSKSTRCVQKLSQRYDINSIYVTSNDNYLIGSDASGRICKWDLRKRSIICEYKDHCSSHRTHPIQVEEELGLLYAVGNDRYVRIWDMNSTELLHTLPAPVQVSQGTTPAVYIPRHYHNISAFPVMLMGVKDKIHLYAPG